MLIKQTNEMTEQERIAAQNSNNQYLAALSHVSVGTVYPFVGDEAPMGFMICDGSSLDKNEYSELFDVIGYTFGGSGDIFNIPDFSGKTLVGLNSSDNDFKKVGISGGEKEVVLRKEHLPEHNHGINLLGGDAGNLDKDPGVEWIYNPENMYEYGGDDIITNTGSNQPHNNMPPYVVVNYIIKVKFFPYDTDFLKTADLTYNPESENAQSGKALKPVFENRLAVYVEGVTYYPNQWVVATIVEPAESENELSKQYNACLLCMKEHTATSNILLTTGDALNNYFDFITPLTAIEAANADVAERAWYDGFGNPIHETYATKEAIGNIETVLDGIITIQNSLIGGESV